MKNLLTILLWLSTIVGITQNTVTSVSNGNWSNPSTWDIGVPNTGDNIYIEHQVTLDIGDTVHNIRMNNNLICDDTLYINGFLKINGDITLNEPIVFVNDSINKGRLGRVTNGSTMIGDVVWQKYIERCDGWGMYGGPFDVPLIDYGFIHSGFPSTMWPTFWCNTYYYDETIPNTNLEIGWVAPNNVNDILPRGQGVFIFDSSSSVTNDARVMEIIGSVDLTENFNYNITYSGINNSVDNGWNLVSNPWLGTIDWDRNGWTKIMIEDAIWVWDNCTNNYTSYVNGVGVNGGQPQISSGQAFWVKVIKSNPILKSKSKVLINGNQEIKMVGGMNDGLVRVSLNSDEIAFVVDTNATNNYDKSYDAVKFLCGTSTLYTQIDTNIYSINSVKDRDTTALYVYGDGVLNFDISELSVLPTMYYLDRVTGIVYDMSVNPTYTFTDTTSGFNHRFDIIIPQITTDIEEVEVIDTDRVIMHRCNVLGQSVTEDYDGIIIEVYDDGSVRKILRLK